ncbi:transmembrane amino acid transporter protein-domain-containing protein [Dactylonectria macrodidyma]|uniref:Transmembrane amino acid transporter protein-domain-containing protein n=1 Tax=Dactylonectria macrodidyma TaxID=307937 RepID=A0A9P9FMC3_9HYPO|nr:transmembrane amino acid transporter protein-domain-containing protein [Dactylonectria macrodidyma]
MSKPHKPESGDMVKRMSTELEGQSREIRQKTTEGDAHFHRLGWKRLTVVLIVEAIALGCLSLPAAFATLGMFAGVFLTVTIGLIAIYTSYIIGQVKIKMPEISHYADVGRAMGAKIGFPRTCYEIMGAMFCLQLIFLTGSHCLTGTIAFLNITDNSTCSLVFGGVSGVILLLLAVPPSFTEVAILGYIDFASIVTAVGITMITTGIHSQNKPSDWSAWPKEGTGLADAFIVITNIVFAYSFAICQFSFMDEMHTPTDYVKSIWTLGLLEIVMYTLTGAVVYSFVGQDVASPALLSNGSLIAKISFGVALPVIYISGSIGTTVAARYIHGRIFRDTVAFYVNTTKGWVTWLTTVIILTVIGWVIAESIPFFSDLLSIISALFISGFSFYFPGLMWFLFLQEGPWYRRENILMALGSGFAVLFGLIVLVGGLYASVHDIIRRFDDGRIGGVFTCAPLG